ncbi:roadblock/LC7 domain-containing protein [Streptomyces sp. NPDC005500]|uniref:roadblock/LC7 domain-containing protein n=1 Tax=Streptomyces sp. NPDC005500 TaxID=3155007 RepID=UPI0033B5539E
MSPLSPAARNLNWLTSEFVHQVPAVSHAVVVSSDGLLLAFSDDLPQQQAERLAAITSGIVSITHAGAHVFDAGKVIQTMVELPTGYLLLMAISDGSCLAAFAARGCDLGQVGFEMTTLVDRCGEWLTPAVRTELQGALRE